MYIDSKSASQYARRITGDRNSERFVQETFIRFQRNGALRREDGRQLAIYGLPKCRAQRLPKRETNHVRRRGSD